MRSTDCKPEADGTFQDWTEDTEKVSGDYTPIFDGDWKVNVHKLGSNFGYRRYHKHEDKWHCVRSSGDGSGIYLCTLCQVQVPDDMEGYINLARWSTDANRV